MSIVWEKTMNKPAKRKKITNSDEMQDALVEDYFRYEELAEIEAEAIRHNMTGVKNNNIYYEEVNAVLNELDPEPEGDENNSDEVLDNFETENNSGGEAKSNFFLMRT
jgi:hypothetical protein